MRRSLAAAASAWFSKGMRFECTKCGKCCKRPNAHVWVSSYEVEDMAKHLGMDVQIFSETFLTEGSYGLGEESSKLLIKRGPDGESCIFLDAQNKCKVHPAKPVHCATYPFHGNHLVSHFDWNAEAVKCEGMTPVNYSESDAHERPTVEDDLIPERKIFENILMEEWSNSDDASESYRMMKDVLYGLDDDVLDEFSDEYVRENWRRIVYQNDRHLVVDSHFWGEETGRRALILKDAPTFVQTEIPYDHEDSSETQLVVELVQPPHQGMLLGLLTWAQGEKHHQTEDNQSSNEFHIAVLGAGCGALPNALLDLDLGVNARVTAVELDPAVLEIGAKYFGFNRREGLEIVCGNAINYLESCPEESLDVVLLDVAAMGGAECLVAPPAEFCGEKVVQDLHKGLHLRGIVVVNVVGGLPMLLKVFRSFEVCFKDVWALHLPAQTLLFVKKGGVGTEKMWDTVKKLHGHVLRIVTSTMQQIKVCESSIGGEMGWLDGVKLGHIAQHQELLLDYTGSKEGGGDEKGG